MSSVGLMESLLVILSSLSGPSRYVDAEILWHFTGNREDAGRYTESVDDVRALIKQEMPGWIYRLAECSVSDDAWLIPDFNDPVHGPGFLQRFPGLYQVDPVGAFGTDIDRRPSGQPAIALCMALVTAKIAIMKLEN